MKIKLITVLICIALGLTLTGCGAPNTETELSATQTETPTIVTSPVENTTETPSGTEAPESGTTPAENTTELPSETEAPETVTTPEQNTAETPSESDTPEHEQTSTTPEQTTVDTLLRCTASSLNVRQGAGTSYKVLGTLDKGDMVMPIRKTGDWYEIWYLGASAYASASYLTEATFEKENDLIEQVIAEGKKLLGIPYVYGAQRYHFGNGSLNSAYDGKSYDCSSLMQYIFKIGANVNLAMTSREQSLQGKEISRDQIRRGDLLFFTNASRFDKTGLERIGHVALYLGDNIILHTASDHAVIEQITDLRSSYYITARRLID